MLTFGTHAECVLNAHSDKHWQPMEYIRAQENTWHTNTSITWYTSERTTRIPKGSMRIRVLWMTVSTAPLLHSVGMLLVTVNRIAHDTAEELSK